MTHYEVLGVAVDSDPGDVRRAYLRLARQHHPDRHGGGSVPAGAAAEERMRQLNAAWAVLRDPERRAAYDRSLAAAGGPDARGATGAPVHEPSTEFRPYDAEDEPEDPWRYEPDEYDPRTGLGRWLAVGPPLLVLVGVALLAGSLVVGLRALAAAALACLGLAGVLFLGAPLVALFKSQVHEGRSRDGP